MRTRLLSKVRKELFSFILVFVIFSAPMTAVIAEADNNGRNWVNPDGTIVSDAPDSLSAFLSSFAAGYSDNFGGTEYDCENAVDGTSNIIWNLIRFDGCVPYYLYPCDELETVWDGDDPRGWAVQNDFYNQVSASTINWICTNIFNLSLSDVRVLTEQGEHTAEDYRRFYLDGGYYYWTHFTFGDSSLLKIKYDAITTDGTYYYVVYSAYDYYDDTRYSTNYTVVQPKKVDGEEYWSMYYHSSDIPASSVMSTADSYGAITISGENYTISFSQARQEEKTVQVSAFSSGGDRLTGYEPRNITLIVLKPGSRITVSSNYPYNYDFDYGLESDEAGGEVGQFAGKNRFDFYYSGAVTPIFRTETVNWTSAEMRCPPDADSNGNPYYVVMESALTTGHFDDVSNDSPYAQAIQWAVDEGITLGNGATTFNPSGTCTVRHILTFLWRSQGSPEVYISTLFEAGYDDFGKAARWAYQRNLITGSYNDLAPCTRAQAVWYLWTLAGRPRISGNTFSDVPTESTYADAIAWAASTGITNGFSDGTFRPGATCTRGQIVTFLYRAFGKATEQDLSSRAGYSDDELCAMAIEYYRNQYFNEYNSYPTAKLIADVDHYTDDGQVVIHIYEIVDGHTATYDWYTVNRLIGRGYDFLGNPIKLSRD